MPALAAEKSEIPRNLIYEITFSALGIQVLKRFFNAASTPFIHRMERSRSVTNPSQVLDEI
jgi:hypothetical protein